MKKLLLAFLMLAFGQLFAQLTISDYGGAIVVKENADTIIVMQKESLVFRSVAPPTCQFLQGRKILLEFPYTSVSSPSVSSADALVSIVAGWISSTAYVSYDNDSLIVGNDTVKVLHLDTLKLQDYLYLIDYKSDTIFLNADTIQVGGTNVTYVGDSLTVNSTYIDEFAIDDLFLPKATATAGRITWATVDPLFSIGTNNLFWSGGNITTSGTGANVAIGKESGNLLSTGARNTFLGTEAGNKISTLSENVCIGWRAMYNGNYSNVVMIGAGAGLSGGGGNSTIIGYEASYITQGTGNCVFGYRALRGSSATGCDYNVSIGFNSGYAIPASIDKGIYIGYEAGYNVARSNMLYMDNKTETVADNHFIAGNMDADTLDFNCSVRFGSGQSVNVTTVNSATYDILSTDYIIHVTYTATDTVTSITLPTALLKMGRTFVIKDAGFNASINPITIDTEGTEKIDGADEYIIDTSKGSIMIYSKTGNWYTY